MTRPRRLAPSSVLAIALVALVGLVACSSDDASSPAATAVAAPADTAVATTVGVQPSDPTTTTIEVVGIDPSLGTDQAKVVELTVQVFAQQGVTADVSCVNDLARQLSDADAAALVAAGTDGSAQLSTEGQSLGAQIFSCADPTELVDRLVASISAGADVDEQCVRDSLTQFDAGQLASLLQLPTGDPRMTGLVNEIEECTAAGGAPATT